MSQRVQQDAQEDNNGFGNYSQKAKPDPTEGTFIIPRDRTDVLLAGAATDQ